MKNNTYNKFKTSIYDTFITFKFNDIYVAFNNYYVDDEFEDFEDIEEYLMFSKKEFEMNDFVNDENFDFNSSLNILYDLTSEDKNNIMNAIKEYYK